MADLTDDSITEICNRMGILQLKNFLETSERNYKLCHKILEERKRLIEKQLQKYFLKLKILKTMNSIEDLYDVLDLTYMDINGNGIRIIPEIEFLKLPADSRMVIPGYPLLYTSPRNVDYIVDILNTTDPR